MHVFYAPNACPPLVTLDETESGHAVRVLRLKPGDRVWVVDGVGSKMEGTIETDHPRRCSVHIDGDIKIEFSSSGLFTLVLSPPKNNDRMEWLVEKATEIGIHSFEFIHSRYSERKSINTDRLRKVAIAAMKQSGRATLPYMGEMVPFFEIVNKPFDGSTFIAHCYPGEKPHLMELLKPNQNIRVLIGPEGDFSPEEVQQALKAGFEEVSLGKSRLRTETAALVACHTASLINP